MMKFALPVFIALTLLAPFKFFVSTLKLVDPVDKVTHSLVKVTLAPDHVCTGFIVASKKVLTAAHCVSTDGVDLAVDHEPATLRAVSSYYDLAVLDLQTSILGPVVFRDAPVTLSESLIGLGYGWGWTKPLIMKETVLLPAYSVTPDVPVGIIVQGGYIAGMSGGPVIDLGGKVVGIIQQSNNSVGYGVGTQLIKAFLLDADVTLK